MSRLIYAAMVLLCSPLACPAALLASQARDQGNVIFVYPKNVQSERDLSVCPDHTACSIVYRRFWLPLLVERHCRCPAPSECGWNWSATPNNHSLTLDNRAQFQFCTSLKALSPCNRTEIALKLDTRILHHVLSKPHSNHPKALRVSDPRAVTAMCYCSEPHQWEPMSNEGTAFRCAQLDTCNELDVCGFMRTDLFSVSYRCSCPIGYECITQDKRTHSHRLLLYSGPVYTALCTFIIHK